MAKAVSTEDFRNTHGKRPAGDGTWVFEISYCSKMSMYNLSYLRTTDVKAVAKTERINEHTYRVTFKSGSYRDATALLRRVLRHDRNAVIAVQP